MRAAERGTSEGRSGRVGAAPLAALALVLGAGSGACGGGDARGGPPAPSEVAYVDSASCAGCHEQQWDLWRGSHHDLAMQEATDETVLGDFDDASFEHFEVTTRFFRRGGDYFVHTEGPDGELADFRVAYTFGVEPLQQYLVEFPGGRIQCLTIAWDVERGRWYSLYPDERIAPDDPLHWTGRYQRWNAMCADCHSTQLEKNYDVETDTYDTTWHELDVGCQACHGPGDEHLAWAAALGEAAVEPDHHKGLVTRLRRHEQQAEIDACAPCHSRRAQVDRHWHGEPFLEDFVPERLHAGLYHADGQILDEVYVYGSFVQSKMHAAGVACSDCHEPHSLQLFEPGDGTCLACHAPEAPLERFPTLQAKDYTAREHHHHPPDSDGARCVNCHAPERTYMGIDERRDHSFRIPRPDLTLELGTPNACADCHADETPEWAAERFREWYGPEVAEHPFARAFAGARAGDPAAYPGLVEVALDPEQPALVRATALELLRGFGPEAVQAAQALLGDDDPLVRSAAVRGLDPMPAAQRLQAVTILDDESPLVRAEAARVMAAGPIVQLGTEWGAIFDRARADYVTAQQFGADLPAAHLNLGVLHDDLRELEAAAKAYTKALELDPGFLPARFNLATCLNKQGRNRGALAVLEKGLEHAALAGDTAAEGELHYSLGLLLAEMGELERSADSLLAASARLPDRRGVQRNAGLALQRIGRAAEAARVLAEGARRHPEDPELQHALAYLYLAEGDRVRALEHAARLKELSPDSPEPEELVRRMQQDLDAETAGGTGR